MVRQLSDAGLLGADTTYIHACYLDDEEWRLVADSGGTVSIASQVEMQMGHGWPPVMKAVEFGIAPSLSIDVVTSVPGDMFTQMRSVFACERARTNAIAGVPEYWVVDVPAREVVVHRGPRATGYAEIRAVGAGDTLRPVALPHDGVAVGDLLP